MEEDRAAEFRSPSGGASSLSSADWHDVEREMPIEELVAIGPASVRLTNTISHGASFGKLPCQTVGEYLDAGANAQNMFMHSLPNFGQKSARELDALVQEHLAGVSSGPDTPTFIASSNVGPKIVGIERVNEIVAMLDGLTLADTLKGQNASRRLANALVSSDLGGRLVADLFGGDAAYRAELLRQPNFGRTSLNELETLCRRAVVRVLAKQYDDLQKIINDCAVLFQVPAEGAHSAKLNQEILKTLQNLPPKNCGLDQLMDWALSHLAERELDIVIRRYGLANEAAETLEQIGQQYCITRERIRQVEAKSVRRLREKLEGTSLPMLVDDASERFWTDRSVPFLVIAEDEVNQLRRELQPKLALALDVLDQSVGAWLERTSTPMVNGYLSPSIDANEVRVLGKRLRDRLKDQPLPISVYETLEDKNIDICLVEAAVSLETSFVLFESYLLRDRPRARLRRAVRLHALLCAEKRILTVYELGNIYFQRFEVDQCSLRDIVIVMDFSPQLFLEIEEGLWAALGRGGPSDATIQPDIENETLSEIDQSTIAGSIQEVLRLRGPSLVGDLYRDADSFLPSGRSRNSIAPVLLGRPELFHRVLPGLYALPDQLPTPDEMLHAPLPYLLTEAQGRTYAFGRLAGEPFGVFPLWIPVAEYRLCAWARFDASPALFHSLLSIATVDVWPIPPVQKGEWKRLAELHGRFELSLPEGSSVQLLRPGLDCLLAATLIALERGSIGWLQVNRILGRRLDAAGGQGLLALMVALGIVDVPNDDNDVQLRPHLVAGKAVDVAQKMTAELLRWGELQWDSLLGDALSAEAMAIDNGRYGWVTLKELTELLRAESDEQTSHDLAEQSDEQESDEDLIARLIGEHRRSIDNNRREKATKWLLED